MVTITIQNQTIDIPTLDTVVEDIQALSENDYALARRKGLGASDSGVLFGVNPYKTKDDLIIEKRSKKITEEELAVKTKDAVRKGFDLEPLILKKFSILHDGNEPIKPISMYCCTELPHLTINFDGIIFENDILIPVEAKFVTIYGDKYYNRKNAFQRELGDCTLCRATRPYTDHTDRVKAKAEAVGIPPYYYTQVQQQIYGLNAPYGYLVALHDKGWETVVYHIPRDEEAINCLKVLSTKTWSKITK